MKARAFGTGAALGMLLLGCTSNSAEREPSPDGDGGAFDAAVAVPAADAEPARFDIERYRCQSVVEVDFGADGRVEERATTTYGLARAPLLEEWDTDADGVADLRWTLERGGSPESPFIRESWDDGADGTVEARSSVTSSCFDSPGGWGAVGCVPIGAAIDHDGDGVDDETWADAYPDLLSGRLESETRDAGGVRERWTATFAGTQTDHVDWDREDDGAPEARISYFYSEAGWLSRGELDRDLDGSPDATVRWTVTTTPAGDPSGGDVLFELDEGADGTPEVQWTSVREAGEGFYTLRRGPSAAPERTLRSAYSDSASLTETDVDADGHADFGFESHSRTDGARSETWWSDDDDDGRRDRTCTMAVRLSESTMDCSSRPGGPIDYRFSQALTAECLNEPFDRFAIGSASRADGSPMRTGAWLYFERDSARPRGLAASRAYSPSLRRQFLLFDAAWVARSSHLAAVHFAPSSLVLGP